MSFEIVVCVTVCLRANLLNEKKMNRFFFKSAAMTMRHELVKNTKTFKIKTDSLPLIHVISKFPVFAFLHILQKLYAM